MSYLCFILVKYDALRVKIDACALSPMQYVPGRILIGLDSRLVGPPLASSGIDSQATPFSLIGPRPIREKGVACESITAYGAILLLPSHQWARLQEFCKTSKNSLWTKILCGLILLVKRHPCELSFVTILCYIV